MSRTVKLTMDGTLALYDQLSSASLSGLAAREKITVSLMIRRLSPCHKAYATARDEALDKLAPEQWDEALPVLNDEAADPERKAWANTLLDEYNRNISTYIEEAMRDVEIPSCTPLPGEIVEKLIDANPAWGTEQILRLLDDDPEAPEKAPEKAPDDKPSDKPDDKPDAAPET